MVPSLINTVIPILFSPRVVPCRMYIFLCLLFLFSSTSEQFEKKRGASDKSGTGFPSQLAISWRESDIL